MKHVNYLKWAEYVYEITRQYLPGKPKVLELAAGNCNFTKFYSRYYKEIIASDLSFSMLKEGRKNFKRVCCDMTRLPFKGRFHLIYSTFDSVNYLLSKKKLLSFFKEVNRILDDEGILTFDASLEQNSLKHAEESFRTGLYKGIYFEHTSEYNVKTRMHKNSFHLNYKGDIYTEVHRQKIYSFETFFDLIEKAGLYTAECFENFTFKKGNSDSDRVQFIVKKAKKHAYS